MDLLLKIFLPISLAIIMFSLGIELKYADFKRVVQMPRAVLTGLIGQLFLLPGVTFVCLLMIDLNPAIEFGIMLLSFAPGGVTSNMLTKYANGSVALSVTMTAIASIVCIFTLPILVLASSDFFLKTEAPKINVGSIGLTMALITAVPVLIGVTFNHYKPALTRQISKPVSICATVLFVVIVIGAIASNFQQFIDNYQLTPVLIGLNFIMLFVGYLGAMIAKLSKPDALAIALEIGVQNATLGITVGALIAATGEALPIYSLASGLYGVTMYICAFVFIFIFRLKSWRSSNV